MEGADFDRDVLERSRTIPVLVDFWAEWCGPCRVLGPVLERLASASGGRWVLAKVNTDLHQETARQYGIRGIPAVKLFVDGAVTDEFTGAMPEAALERWLRRALPDPHRARLAEAARFLEKGERDPAGRILEEVLRDDGGNEQARVLRARLLLEGNPEEAAALVEGVEEDSPHHAGAEAVRTVRDLARKGARPEDLPPHPVRGLYLAAIGDLVAGRYEAALEGFLEVIRTQRSYDGEGARRACIAVFRLLGEEHELTRRKRRDFSSALNR
ncbi:MAG: tetratricopeptide repeat protein [Bacteroidota bacterium]